MRKQILKNAPPEKLEQLDRLREQVKHAEDHEQYDTAHHAMLRRLEEELGLIPTRKIEDQSNGVKDDGK